MRSNDQMAWYLLPKTMHAFSPCPQKSLKNSNQNQQFWQIKRHLENHHIFLHAYVNKNMPLILLFEIGKPIWFSIILYLNKKNLNMSQ